MTPGMSFFDTIDREGRFGEWMTSAAILAVGVILAMPGDTMRFSEWWSMRDFGLREPELVLFCTLVGALRCVVLYINGSWHRTPILRGIGATIGVCFFGLMTLVSAWPWVIGAVSAPDMNLAFYIIFALADIRGCHRAGLDSRIANLAS